ncbi:MAG: hypothetical protein JRI89_12330 [Deltaproteobacteria bacterium]|nr:hypothetical protein [Deltaproteobacteria bacterium]
MINGVYGYLDPEFIRQTAKLKPTILRFPGGTVANFFHWQQGGFIKAELKSSASKELNRRLLRQSGHLYAVRPDGIRFDDFMELCKRLAVNPLLVVNLFTGTPAESAAWVQYVKNKGYTIAGWELGNEMYLPAYRNRVFSVQEYIRLAKKHAAAMKAVDNTIRLGVPAHPAGFHLQKASRYGREWNEALARENFYDAYVVHMYVHLKKYAQRRTKIDLDHLRKELFTIDDTSFQKAISYYDALFGKREMWVTEWNIMKPKDVHIADTLLHALYTADFFIQLINGVTPIRIACYHVLAGVWNGFPTFTPGKMKGGKAATSIKRASYFAFELIGDVVADSTRVFPLKIDNGPMLEKTTSFPLKSIPGIKAACLGSDNGKHYILVTNRTAQTVTTQVIVNGRQAAPQSLRYIGSTNINSLGAKGQILIKDEPLTGEQLQLKPTSFAVIVIP